MACIKSLSLSKGAIMFDIVDGMVIFFAIMGIAWLIDYHCTDE